MTVLNVVIVVMLAAIGWVTLNPLVLLGLMMLRDIPVVPPDFNMNNVELEQNEDTENAMGFMSGHSQKK